MKLAWQLAACSVGLGTFATVAAAIEPEVIVQRAVQAHGGRGHLEKLKAGQSRTRGLFANGIGFTQEACYQLPDQLREIQDLELPGAKTRVTVGLAGSKGWIKRDAEVQELPGPLARELREAINLLNVCRLFPLLDGKTYLLSTVAPATVSGQHTDAVRVRRDGYRDIVLYFSSDSGLLLKAERQTLDAKTSQEVVEERIFLEYHSVDGVMTAGQVLVRRGGEAFSRGQVEEVRYLEHLDNWLFRP